MSGPRVRATHRCQIYLTRCLELLTVSMSNKPDIKEVVMPFEEKFTWVSAGVSTGVTAVYFAIVLGQVRAVPVAEIRPQERSV
jgi:hypothetical protein